MRSTRSAVTVALASAADTTSGNKLSTNSSWRWMDLKSNDGVILIAATNRP